MSEVNTDITKGNSHEKFTTCSNGNETTITPLSPLAHPQCQEDSLAIASKEDVKNKNSQSKISPLVFDSSDKHCHIIPRFSPKPLLPTIFGRVPEKSVTFCIDTSGSMFNYLDVIKQHLMETLTSMASQEDQPMFNLIDFNSQVTQWADKMVKCTPETVAVAEKWIRNLQAKTGTNTEDALLTALSDPSCEAIYLVTDGLPDQYPDDVLDSIVGICGSRQIHCIYITGETADETATEFLEDLAVETFGSFHIVTLSTHGCIERVTPIYRYDHAHEKIVHTVNSTLRPNIKTCSVSTSLQVDPEELFGLTPYANALLHYPYSLGSPLMGGGPTRYFYPYYWSRYRPAKAWLKNQDKWFNDPLLGLSPAAGSLLVGKKVIARRIDDGFFYRATVQSQNLGEKFLVAFGPSKHGKYKQTEYQDTYVFDIVDYHDALRHTIITGDYILAPWEPEGERFGPGIVIEGHEKRHAEGPEDVNLTVSFSHGVTEKIPLNTAVWIPPSVYDRLSLELQMPKEARKTLLSCSNNYPIDNLPGYPAAGPVGDPPEFPKADPFVIEPKSVLWDPYFYHYPPYLPAYYWQPPFVISRKETIKKDTLSSGATEDNGTVIPGTNLTRKELDDRVMSQLMEHRLTMEEEKTKVTESGKEDARKLLNKRDRTDENLLKRSVHFSEKNESKEMEDQYLKDSEYDYGNLKSTMDSGVNTDSSLLFYTTPGIKVRPRWNYWRNDPTPNYSEMRGSLLAGMNRSKSAGPFRETALQAPLEARDQREYAFSGEWPSSAFKFVDTFAKHDHSNTVGTCLNGPKPPLKNDTSYHPHNCNLLSKPIVNMTPEEKEEALRANRRRRVLKREADWQVKLAETDHIKSLMQDHHRERILKQMERDRQRQIKESEDIQKVREAKKKISSELKAKIVANQKDEAVKEQQRIEALKRRRERREQIQTQRDKEIEASVARRELIRKQNNDARLKAWTEKLNDQESKEAATDKQHRNAKHLRLKHFRELEKVAQEKKDLRIFVNEKTSSCFMELGKGQIRKVGINNLYHAVHPDHGVIWTDGKAIYIAPIKLQGNQLQNAVSVKLGEFEHVSSVHWSRQVNPEFCYLCVNHQQNVTVWQVSGTQPKPNFKQVRKINVKPIPQGCLWNPISDLLCLVSKQQCSFYYRHNQDKGSFGFPSLESSHISCGCWSPDGNKLVLCVGSVLLIYRWSDVTKSIDKFAALAWQIPGLQGHIVSIFPVMRDSVVVAAEIPLETLFKQQDILQMPDIIGEALTKDDVIQPKISNTSSLFNLQLNMTGPQSGSTLNLINLMDGTCDPQCLSTVALNGVVSPDILLFEKNSQCVVVGSNSQSQLHIFALLDKHLAYCGDIQLEKSQRPKGLCSMSTHIDDNGAALLILVGQREKDESGFLSSSLDTDYKLSIKYIILKSDYDKGKKRVNKMSSKSKSSLGIVKADSLRDQSYNLDSKFVQRSNSTITAPTSTDIRIPHHTKEELSSLGSAHLHLRPQEEQKIKMIEEISDISEVNSTDSLDIQTVDFSHSKPFFSNSKLLSQYELDCQDKTLEKPEDVCDKYEGDTKTVCGNIKEAIPGHSPFAVTATPQLNKVRLSLLSTQEEKSKSEVMNHDLQSVENSATENLEVTVVKERNTLHNLEDVIPQFKHESICCKSIKEKTIMPESELPKSEKSESLESGLDDIEQLIKTQKDCLDALHDRLENLTQSVEESCSVNADKSLDINLTETIEICCEKPTGVEKKIFLLDHGQLHLETVKLAFCLATVELNIGESSCVLCANVDGYIPLKFSPHSQIKISGQVIKNS
ncbi:hypothetical protein Btru_001029 [Bulinus truncatus]|nr:hypothetical protein Btru_001029 [Bulinus truncatus]